MELLGYDVSKHSSQAGARLQASLQSSNHFPRHELERAPAEKLIRIKTAIMRTQSNRGTKKKGVTAGRNEIC